MTTIAAAVVVTFAVALLAFSATAFAKPPAARRLLESFAGSARAHLIEQGLRILAGAALVTLSAEMRWPPVFRLLGWVLIATSAALLCVPWRWHQWFARQVIPPVIRHLSLYAIVVAVFAALLLYGVFAG